MSAASSAAALVLLEVGLRIALPPTTFLDPTTDAYWIAHRRVHPELSHDLVPDPTLGWRMGSGLRADGVTTNARGTRGALDHEPADATRADRIVVLGDSFTFGLGVLDDETYANALSRELPGMETINLGIGGFGVDQALLMWETEGVRYRPAVVVLGCFVDDYNRNLLSIREFAKPRYVLEDGNLRLVPAPAPTPDATEGRAGALLRTFDAFGYVRREIPRRLGVEISGDALARIAELGDALIAALERSVRENGARLVVAVIPHSSYEGHPDAEPITRSIVETCARRKIPCVDLTPIFLSASRGPGTEPLYGENGHWSAAGHRLAAREIARLLRN